MYVAKGYFGQKYYLQLLFQFLKIRDKYYNKRNNFSSLKNWLFLYNMSSKENTMWTTSYMKNNNIKQSSKVKIKQISGSFYKYQG